MEYIEWGQQHRERFSSVHFAFWRYLQSWNTEHGDGVWVYYLWLESASLVRIVDGLIVDSGTDVWIGGMTDGWTNAHDSPLRMETWVLVLVLVFALWDG